MNLPSRRAKIVATLGPTSSDLQTIENLIKAGVNVFRINFSHGVKKDHQLLIKTIREAIKKLDVSVAILQDLQGPKLRVGTFENHGMQLEKGENIVLLLETLGSKKGLKTIPYNYQKLSKEIKPENRILLDDGNLEFVVTEVKQDEIYAQVVYGGLLKDHKGMNFPDTRLSIESFTPKDKADLLFGLEMDVDFVALSFVRSASDVRTIQKFMHSHKRNIPVVSKIEKSEALANLYEILQVTDSVMVARGDLAVEVGTAQVPSLQKKIIRDCNLLGIPVITATQMLESMIYSPRPTRAEASDVANAVLDGSDALMLSAETASGKFPVLSVSVMHNIILETELRRTSFNDVLESPKDVPVNPSLVVAIEHAASNVAKWLNATAIACTTHTGEAARALAKYRPTVPVVAFTDSPEVRRRLALVWGIETCLIEPVQDLEKLFNIAEEELAKRNLAKKGDLIVFTAGWPPLKHGTTNLLKVVTIRKDFEQLTSKQQKENLLGYRTRKAQFVLDQNLCIQCGGCVEVCPNDIFGKQGREVYLKEENCKNCTFDDACIEICPTGAIEIIQLDS